MLQLRNSFKISPRYLTSLILLIYWPLILKLSCLVMLDWDFGLNNIISVLLVFNILFALSQMFSSFKSWLMCLFIFSSDFQAVVSLYHLQNDVHHYIWLLCWGHLCRRGTVKDPRQIPEGLHSWYMHFLKRNCLLLCAVLSLQIHLEPLEFSSSWFTLLTVSKTSKDYFVTSSLDFTSYINKSMICG